MLRRFLVAFLFVSTLPLFAGSKTTTIYLVRHAEKVVDASTQDPPLTDAGKARAAELSRALADVPLTAVYVTQFERTKSTGTPVAQAHHLEPIVVQAKKDYATELATRLKSEAAGKSVLVVGHSNTTPDLIHALGVATPPTIADSEYDDLFIVTLLESGEAQLTILHYGAVAR